MMDPIKSTLLDRMCLWAVWGFGDTAACREWMIVCGEALVCWRILYIYTIYIYARWWYVFFRPRGIRVWITCWKRIRKVSRATFADPTCPRWGYLARPGCPWFPCNRMFTRFTCFVNFYSVPCQLGEFYYTAGQGWCNRGRDASVAWDGLLCLVLRWHRMLWQNGPYRGDWLQLGTCSPSSLQLIPSPWPEMRYQFTTCTGMRSAPQTVGNCTFPTINRVPLVHWEAERWKVLAKSQHLRPWSLQAKVSQLIQVLNKSFDKASISWFFFSRILCTLGDSQLKLPCPKALTHQIHHGVQPNHPCI